MKNKKNICFLLLAIGFCSLTQAKPSKAEKAAAAAAEEERKRVELEASKNKVMTDFPIKNYSEVFELNFPKETLFRELRHFFVENLPDNAPFMRSVGDNYMILVPTKDSFAFNKKEWGDDIIYNGDILYYLVIEIKDGKIRVSTADVKVVLNFRDGGAYGPQYSTRTIYGDHVYSSYVMHNDVIDNDIPGWYPYVLRIRQEAVEFYDQNVKTIFNMFRDVLPLAITKESAL